MSNYAEITKILKDFFERHIDITIGDLTLNEVSQLADDLDKIEDWSDVYQWIAMLGIIIIATVIMTVLHILGKI